MAFLKDPHAHVLIQPITLTKMEVARHTKYIQKVVLVDQNINAKIAYLIHWQANTSAPWYYFYKICG